MNQLCTTLKHWGAFCITPAEVWGQRTAKPEIIPSPYSAFMYRETPWCVPIYLFSPQLVLRLCYLREILSAAGYCFVWIISSSTAHLKQEATFLHCSQKTRKWKIIYFLRPYFPRSGKKFLHILCGIIQVTDTDELIVANSIVEFSDL